jgi:DNA end-binding protein Ku
VGDAEVKGPELQLARQVIASLEAPFDPQALVSDYRRDLRALLEAKLSGQEIAEPEPAKEAPVVDLMEALRASVAAAKTGPAEADGAKKAAARPRKKAAARKAS